MCRPNEARDGVRKGTLTPNTSSCAPLRSCRLWCMCLSGGKTQVSTQVHVWQHGWLSSDSRGRVIKYAISRSLHICCRSCAALRVSAVRSWVGQRLGLLQEQGMSPRSHASENRQWAELHQPLKGKVGEEK